jgi:organic hydroperoxide reductase OsmC/OhrA
MERFPFSVRWSGSTATRAYTRDAVAGAPGKVEIPLSAGDPAIGDVTRWNPEDMLGASLATCHMLTFLALAAKVGVDVRSYEENGHAALGTVDRVTRVTTIVLAPTIRVAPGSDVEKARAMFEKAHTYCYIANSITSEVVMQPDIVVDA